MGLTPNSKNSPLMVALTSRETPLQPSVEREDLQLPTLTQPSQKKPWLSLISLRPQALM